MLQQQSGQVESQGETQFCTLTKCSNALVARTKFVFQQSHADAGEMCLDARDTYLARTCQCWLLVLALNQIVKAHLISALFLVNPASAACMSHCSSREYAVPHIMSA